ncbi:MAG TPA: HlyD family efflux transporter periplasmic adaptor subunit [Bacteroidales bacterium]|nr:HlyD family efflux transporter periplasmic adaptor subunit [Bacteroidales bacterium]
MDIIPAGISDLCLECYFIRINSQSRIIYWSIIGLIVLIILSLPFIFVDITIQAKGYFQPQTERQFVYTPVQGKVLHTNLISGTSLKKGDTLLLFDLESVRARETFMSERITENRSAIHDLEILTQSDPGDSSPTLINLRYQSEFTNLRSRQNVQEQIYLKRKRDHERNAFLYNQKIIADAEFENSLYLMVSAEKDLDHIATSQRSVWQTDLVSRRTELAELQAELELCRETLRSRIILSPVDGEIVQSLEITDGSFVNAGQKIAEISPTGDLIANCFVRPNQIGLIHPGQHVKLQVDAFNYNEWGMLDGEIIDISDDLISEDGSSAYFRVKCRPDKISLTLKNGYTAYIKKGMSLNARIFIIRRSLFNLLFDKAARWFNPYTYSPE